MGVISKLVKFYDSRTTELGIRAGELKSREKVTKDARNRLELCTCEGATVYWACRLTIQPIIDAQGTECVLTLCRLATSVNTMTSPDG